MEYFFELLSIIIGRYIFGLIGLGLRKIWQLLLGLFTQRKPTESNTSKDDFAIDVDDFVNRIVGFIFVVIVVLIIVKL